MFLSLKGYIFFFSSPFFVTSNLTEYIIVLDNVHLHDPKIILRNHINLVISSFPLAKLKRTFPNLIMYDFLAYIALIDEEVLYFLKSDDRVKLIEEVGTVKMASQDSVRSQMPVKTDMIAGVRYDDRGKDVRGSRCTYDYDGLYEYIKQRINNTSARYGAGAVS